jgi:hypothetical protein
MSRPARPSLALASAFALLFAARALAEVTSVPTSAWTIQHTLMVPGSPERAYDAATGDIAPWWDHTFHDKPLKLYIEPWAGGGFYEIWNEQGEGVRHATVIWAERGKHLRIDGPLGLAGHALTLVTTWDFTAKGDSTELKCTASLSGAVPAGYEKAVDQVWHHFLVGRLKPYIESGRDVGKPPWPRARP